MEWSDRMNAAISYIEDNLAGNIDYDEAANRAYCSTHHFQKTFYAIIGITPAEYVRRRRLTLAARELATGKSRIIDIALKYGYDSPVSFSRAFRNLHGVTPTAARGFEETLIAYPRVMFHIELKGSDDMDYRIIEKPAFDIIGISRNYYASRGELEREAPKFWGEWVRTEEYISLLGLAKWQYGPVTQVPVMSAYLLNENETWDPVENVMGIEKTANMNADGFQIFHIPAATYAEFNGTLDKSSDIFKRIHSEWFPSTGYEHDSKPDIEQYIQWTFSRVVHVRWWIPIVKKR